jgi:uncharacterized protein YutE (UPF0331/DUF86 family)
MTDRDLIDKLLALIETSARELRTLAHLDRLADDVRERRFVEHTLQVAIQAALDVASHIVSEQRLGEPETNRELFVLLVGGGWISSELAGTLAQMAGFRNVLVHGYAKVNLDRVRDVVEHGLDDLLAFVTAIRARQ